MKQVLLILSLQLISTICFAGEDVFANFSTSTVTVPQIDYIGNYTDLATAVSKIGATPKTLQINAATVIADGETITTPSTLTLWFTNGGSIDGTAGGSTETLTINGNLQAGMHQIFGSNLTVNGSLKNKEVYPLWFGENTTPGTTDMTDAIQAALNLNTNVKLTKGIYRITSTLNIPKYTSLVGAVGANILADFNVISTWSSDYVALRFSGLGGEDVTINDFNTIFKDMVITSSGASAVEATAVQVPVSATSGTILYSRYGCSWNNIEVVGFDIAYDLSQITNSVVTELKSRNCRVGIFIKGKTVNLYMDHLNLYKGTPETSSAGNSYGVYVQSYLRGGSSEERPNNSD